MVPLSEAKHEFLNYLVSIERSPETVNGYRKDLKTFIRHIESKYNGVVYIDEVTSADIQHYMMYLKQERRLTAVSRNRYLSSIRSLYNFAVKREWVDRNVAAIVEQVKVQRKERTHLTRDELYKLFDAIKHPIIKVAVVFLSYTGLRISEAMNLTFDNVDLERKLMFIKGKGEKLRVVPISDRLYPILINYLEEVREADSDRLFATKKTGKLSPQYVNAVLSQACRQLGWKKQVSAHVLRHSFATEMVQSDVNLVELQRLLGHSSLRTTSIYTHTNEERLIEAVNRGFKEQEGDDHGKRSDL